MRKPPPHAKGVRSLYTVCFKEKEPHGSDWVKLTEKHFCANIMSYQKRYIMSVPGTVSVHSKK